MTGILFAQISVFCSDHGAGAHGRQGVAQSHSVSSHQWMTRAHLLAGHCGASCTKPLTLRKGPPPGAVSAWFGTSRPDCFVGNDS